MLRLILLGAMKVVVGMVMGMGRRRQMVLVQW